MPTYTVKSAIKTKDVPGQHGPMQVIILALEDPESGNTVSAEWFTKASTPIPGEGTPLEGTIEPSQYGPKFKKAQGQFGGGGGRSRSPEESASIVRQHSQEMALRYAAIRQAEGKLPEDFDMPRLRSIIDWFQADAGSTPKAENSNEGARQYGTPPPSPGGYE